MESYFEDPHPGLHAHSDEGEGAGIVSIMASRGCPFDCIYCDHTIKGYSPRYRPVGSVIEEIRLLLERYGDKIEEFYFWDDIFIWDRRWVRRFCEELIEEDLSIKWTCNCHVNLVRPRLMALMKEAGCVNVRFGIESGSQKILDSLNKGVRVEKALDALRVCLDTGLTLTIYIMVGMTGESLETINETMDFFRRLITPSRVYQIKKIHFFMLTPYPGTRLYKKVLEDGLVGDVSQFLQRRCDAYYDIPLNISGHTDQELLRLKNKLEDGIALILEEETNLFHKLLLEMKGG